MGHITSNLLLQVTKIVEYLHGHLVENNFVWDDEMQVDKMVWHLFYNLSKRVSEQFLEC
jgi:hypothetical protein